MNIYAVPPEDKLLQALGLIEEDMASFKLSSIDGLDRLNAAVRRLLKLKI
jgi:hypothetical protein